MTPDERAELQGEAEKGDPVAKEALKSSTSPTEFTAGTAETTTFTTESAIPDAPSAQPASGSLALHSSSASAPSGSLTDVNRKESQPTRDKKTKPKLTPEQKAQLEALDKKKDEEKRAR